jgi:uncharacterized protein involved in exopolysaccharide biosynthesis
MGLSGIVRLLGGHWKRLVAGAVAGAGAGLLMALLFVPMYRAEVLVAPISHSAGAGLGLSARLGGLASIAGISLGGGLDDSNVSVAMLNSRLLAREVVKEGELLPVLFADKWDAKAGKWKTISDNIPSLWDGEHMFSRKVRRINEDRRTGLIVVAAVWNDPQLAALWANELVTRADRNLRVRAIAVAKDNIDFLQGQLNEISILEVRQSIYRLLEDQIKEMMLAQGGAEYAFKVLDPAVVPEQPIGPGKTLLSAAGLLVGLLLACVTILLPMRWGIASSP